MDTWRPPIRRIVVSLDPECTFHRSAKQSHKDSNLEPQSQSLIRCQLHHRTMLHTLVVSMVNAALFPPYHAYESLSDFGRMQNIRYVGYSGIEPETSRLSGECANQLRQYPEASPVLKCEVTDHRESDYNIIYIQCSSPTVQQNRRSS